MSKQSKQFIGTGIALVTPFLKNGNIDFKSLEKIVNHVIKGKCDYLVALGSTG
jgi:4-hydroxy-tetrahydrodipicolinate synthase